MVLGAEVAQKQLGEYVNGGDIGLDHAQLGVEVVITSSGPRDKDENWMTVSSWEKKQRTLV